MFMAEAIFPHPQPLHTRTAATVPVRYGGMAFVLFLFGVMFRLKSLAAACGRSDERECEHTFPSRAKTTRPRAARHSRLKRATLRFTTTFAHAATMYNTILA